MSRRRGPWEDGHRAWARLTVWHAGQRHHSADADADAEAAGDAALDAMAYIGTLRRLLEQAELAAVRTARRHRKSWAEIAIQLGITRQSAWERWRDLDDDAESPASAEQPLDPRAVIADVAAEMAAEIAPHEAQARRRLGRVVVPNVVGMTWDDARHELMREGLVAAGADPDGPPLAALGWPNVIVVDQVPESGAKVLAGSQVRLRLERGGGSAGVREPRRPSPSPKSGYEWREEPSGEAVG